MPIRTEVVPPDGACGHATGDGLFCGCRLRFEHPSARFDQRWHHGVPLYRDSLDEAQPNIDPRAYRVQVIPEADASAFVRTHHYSRSFPVSKLNIGLYRVSDVRRWSPPVHGGLVGVAVLGIPMNSRTLTRVFPTLEPFRTSVELVRFVLHPSVERNGESWFLAAVRRIAADRGVRGMVAFSDPLQRWARAADGSLFELTPGHVGTIYAASNAVSLGKSTRRTLYMVNGVTVSPRTMQKVRSGEAGAASAVARLIQMGARAPRSSEGMARWLAQALEDVGAVKVRHPGNFRFAWALGPRAERRRLPIEGERTPYPKSHVDRVRWPSAS